MGQTGKRMWISPKLFLDQLAFEINQKLISGEVRKLLFSVNKRAQWDIWCVAIATFCKIGSEKVARGLNDVSNYWENVRTPQELELRLIATSKNNFSEIHISQPTP